MNMSSLFGFHFTLLTLAIGVKEVTGDETTGEAAAPPGTSASALVADKQTMLLFELALVALVVAFIIFFILGVSANTNLARMVSNHLAEILSEQFAQIGTDDGKLLVKDGASYFWFYATGRRYTSGLSVLMDLAKRMDMFSFTSSILMSPQKDRCIFFLPLTDDFKMEPVSLFLVRKKELARFREMSEGRALEAAESLGAHISDISTATGDFVIMTEHTDVLHELLPESIRSIIHANSKHLTSIHVTDNGASWEPQCTVSKRLIRIEFVLPSNRKQVPDVLEAMADIAMRLVDKAAQCKISATARKKAQDLRKKAIEEVDRREQKKRAEEAAQRRLDKKKEEEEAVGKMSREKQRKYEEKKRKKELNAKIRKVSRK